MPRFAPQETRTFFVSSGTAARSPLFQRDEMAQLFIDVLLKNREKGRFALHAFVVMPDHFHVLFTPAPNESLVEIKNEMLQKAKLFPSLANEVFVFSQGEPNAEIAIVGESPGPPDIDSEKPFQGPSGDLLNRSLIAKLTYLVAF